jgi:cobalt-precorrin 5A hydrolase
MDLGETLMVAGIGCRSGVSAAQVDAALESALQRDAGPGLSLAAIATAAGKSHEPGIVAAASSRSVPLLSISQAALEAASSRTLTQSMHSLKAMNVGSVAEAAALAGAGPESRLLGPRVTAGPVTCALAAAPSEGVDPS